MRVTGVEGLTLAGTKLRVGALRWDEQHEHELDGILEQLGIEPSRERFRPETAP